MMDKGKSLILDLQENKSVPIFRLSYKVGKNSYEWIEKKCFSPSCKKNVPDNYERFLQRIILKPATGCNITIGPIFFDKTSSLAMVSTHKSVRNLFPDNNGLGSTVHPLR